MTKRPRRSGKHYPEPGRPVDQAIQTEIVGLIRVIEDVYGDIEPRNVDPIITYFIGALEEQRNRDFKMLLGPSIQADLPKKWDRAMFRDFQTAARNMGRQRLAAFWILAVAGRVPDRLFKKTLDSAKDASEQELLALLEISLDPDRPHSAA